MKLSSKQIQAISVIVSAPSITHAAKALSLNEKTLRRWLAIPEFAAEVDRQRNVATKDALAFLRASLSRAASTLTRLLNADDDGIARLAANSLLQHGLKSIELYDFEARLQEVEKKLVERKARERSPFLGHSGGLNKHMKG